MWNKSLVQKKMNQLFPMKRVQFEASRFKVFEKITGHKMKKTVCLQCGTSFHFSVSISAIMRSFSVESVCLLETNAIYCSVDFYCARASFHF
jgi:hypothetical protein